MLDDDDVGQVVEWHRASTERLLQPGRVAPVHVLSLALANEMLEPNHQHTACAGGEAASARDGCKGDWFVGFSKSVLLARLPVFLYTRWSTPRRFIVPE